MIFLIIVLLIVFIILLALLVPIKLEFSIENNKFEVSIFVCFMKFNISESNKKKSYQSRSIHNDLGDFLTKLKSFISKLGLISSLFGFVIKNMKFKKIHLMVRVCADDSKECAINYSYLYAFLKLLIQVFDLDEKTKDLKIRVVPDFLSFKTTYSGKIILSVKLLEIICLFFYYLVTSRRKVSVRE